MAVEVGNSSQLPPAFYRAPKEVQERFLKIREEGASARKTVERWDAVETGGIAAGGTIIGGCTIAVTAPVSVPTGIVIAGGTLLVGATLTGCPAQTTPSQPPYIPPVTDDTEGETGVEGEGEGEAGVEGEGEGAVSSARFPMKSFKMTVEEGQRDANDTDPGGNVGPINVGGADGGITALGYTNKYWNIKNFSGETNFHYILPENIKPEDQGDMAYGLQGVNQTVVQPADVTDKAVAIINVDPSSVLYPGDYVTFPSILVKGATINTESGVNYAKYLTTSAPFVDTNGNSVHDDLEMYYQTGISIAFRRSAPDKQMLIYTYANGDPLTAVAGGTGRVLDPRTVTASHFSWSNDAASIPQMMFGNRYPGEALPVMMNSYPLIDLGETADAKKAFLTGTTGASLPEAATGFGYDIEAVAKDSIPDNGKMYFNLDRVNGAADNANGFQIIDRSQAGLVAATSSVPSRTLTGSAHNQINVSFPAEGVGIPPEVQENGGSMAVRYTATELPIEVNTGTIKANPAVAFKP